MKFHCKQSLSSAIPPQTPSGESTPLPSSGMGRWRCPRAPGGQGTASPAQLPPWPPAHSSLLALPTKGLLSLCPPWPHGSGTWSRNPHHGAGIPLRGAQGPGVTGHSPGGRALALGQSPAAGMSRRYGKNKESVPAITGFSNMANRAIFTGAYLFSEDAGTDSRVSFFSPAVFKDRFELALFKGFASCPLFLTPCTSLSSTPPKNKTNPQKNTTTTTKKCTKTTHQQHCERKPTKGPSVAGSNHHFRRYC